MSINKRRSIANQKIGYERWKQFKDAGRRRWTAEIVLCSRQSKGCWLKISCPRNSKHKR